MGQLVDRLEECSVIVPVCTSTILMNKEMVNSVQGINNNTLKIIAYLFEFKKIVAIAIAKTRRHEPFG